MYAHLAPRWSGGFISSGRSTIFNILVQELIEAHPAGAVIVVTDDKMTSRRSRQLRQQVRALLVEAMDSYARMIDTAIKLHPAILAVDRLDGETIPRIFAATSLGIKVIAPIETILWGTQVSSQLLDLGVQPKQLSAISWIVSIQRLPGCVRNANRRAPPTQAY
jgi:hypothetical protein